MTVLRAKLHEQEIRRVIGVPGEGSLIIETLAPLGAEQNRCLYFISRGVTDAIRESLIARNDCILIARRNSGLAGQLGSCRVLEVQQPRAAIAKVLDFIRSTGRQEPWVNAKKVSQRSTISPLAVIEDKVEICEGVVVEPFCTVGPEVTIGQGSVLRSGARICARVSIGDETIIGANAVIGSEGFGFVRDDAGNKTRIPHLGGVIIGSHVEIGPLTMIQCGTISPTVIEDYVKIDGSVEIAHNVCIARGASVTGGVIIGGSAVVGADAWLGINSSIRDGRRVGSRALVGMGTSIQDDLPDDAVARSPRPDVRRNLGKKLTP
jgi:UDP-3-O-[3-hydroxymyristoyl] glucosamine N-acyltransferase LpxD